MPELHVVGEVSSSPVVEDFVEKLVVTALALADVALTLNDQHGLDLASNYLSRAADMVAHEKEDMKGRDLL